MKYYRVIKDNPLWEVGAVLGQNARGVCSNGYVGIEDIWDKHKNMSEYLSFNIIENSPEFFERVYADNLEKMIFKTKEQLKESFKNFTN